MSVQGSNIKQLAFTPLDSWVASGQQLSKGSVPVRAADPDFDRGRIIGLREAGWSNRRIGRHLGRSDMVVARCWQQWITEGRVYRRGGQDVPGTQMIARIVQSEEWPLRHQQRR
ncbi:HTH_38 domain-containing protein [Trichonephila clavipes]|nr:HTH_38 domain-containing protein [Trichonephila clavipes]